jgi:hypothetical protein
MQLSLPKRSIAEFERSRPRGGRYAWGEEQRL